MPPAPNPDPAATVILLRESHPFDVLMVERNARGMFGSMLVFPGGRVDDEDVPDGLDLEHDLSHRNAAIRELAEETGIVLTPEGAVAGRSVEGRATAASLLVLVSRWVTPEFAPRRFDTRFYLASCDTAPEVVIDDNELVGYAWLTPSEALRRSAQGAVRMVLPTISHLRWLHRRASVEDAFESAQGADARTLVEPRLVDDGSLIPILLPVEADG